MPLQIDVTNEQSGKGLKTSKTLALESNEFLDTIFTIKNGKSYHTIGMVTLSINNGEWNLRWGAHESEDWEVLATGKFKINGNPTL